ncbi:sialate O-acetylesterase [Amphibiibacter pelophylacis]|uniref:Sialate O-acetylesterase n=1 Tax=Amphibiibacter pelophylacis TaxID=1799477 RepID=A0ACC6NZV8_9BURK
MPRISLKPTVLALASLAALALVPLHAAQAEPLYLIGLTGQSNSLGTLGNTPAALPSSLRLGQFPSEQPGWKYFWWDNFAGPSPSDDAALGGATAWGPIVAQPNYIYVGKGTALWGPEVGMARCALAQGYRQFGIVKASRGGGGNGLWDPDSADHHAYTKVISTFRTAVGKLPAGVTPTWSALMYLQGESNTDAEASQTAVRLQRLVDRLGHDLGAAKPLVAVLGEPTRPKGTAWPVTVAQFRGLVQQQPQRYAWVPTQGTPLWDGVHFNAIDQLDIGCRYARELGQLMAFPNSVRWQNAAPTGQGYYTGLRFALDAAALTVSQREAAPQRLVLLDRIRLIGGSTSVAADTTPVNAQIWQESGDGLPLRPVATSQNAIAPAALMDQDMPFLFAPDTWLDRQARYRLVFVTAQGQPAWARFRASPGADGALQLLGKGGRVIDSGWQPSVQITTAAPPEGTRLLTPSAPLATGGHGTYTGFDLGLAGDTDASTAPRWRIQKLQLQAGGLIPGATFPAAYLQISQDAQGLVPVARSLNALTLDGTVARGTPATFTFGNDAVLDSQTRYFVHAVDASGRATPLRFLVEQSDSATHRLRLPSGDWQSSRWQAAHRIVAVPAP